MQKKQNYGQWIFYALIVVAAFFVPKVIQSRYYMTVFNLAFIYLILAAGLNILLGYTGLMSFTQVAFWGIGAYVSALLSIHYKVHFFVALAAAAVFTALVGFLLAIPSLRRLRRFYLSVTTIGFLEITRLVLENWTSVTRGADGLPGIPRPVLFGTRYTSPFDYYYILLIAVVVLTLFSWILKNSRVGRAMLAIREDELAAEIIGVNTYRYKVLAFTLSAFYGGIAGSLYAHMVGYISPDVFIYNEAVIVLCMVLIGGRGYVAGPIVGAMLLTLVPEWLRFLQEYKAIMYGAAVVALAVYMPNGLLGALDHRITLWKERSKAAETPATSGQ
ncbi:MAG: branched-chain amino acid ABC transporter permease [Limnochordia bacterium]|jgi:branched-chain amino acid transport system permease protein